MSDRAPHTIERDNLRFTFSHVPRHSQPELDVWILNVTRISDGHRVGKQYWFDSEPTEDEREGARIAWTAEAEHALIQVEPSAVYCFSCSKKLVSDHDTKYQFDNALWMGLHGGYGMFVDNLDATMPVNTSDRWLESNGEIVDNPAWKPEYREQRVLPGSPDYEAVICHECAHAACEALPWLERLIDSHKSHSHTQDYHDAHPEHYGWDYDRHA